MVKRYFRLFRQEGVGSSRVECFGPLTHYNYLPPWSEEVTIHLGVEEKVRCLSTSGWNPEPPEVHIQMVAYCPMKRIR